MTIQRMLELLEIEHECILRNSHDDCDRKCADCDLVQDDEELHVMYTDLIALLKEQSAACMAELLKDTMESLKEQQVQPKKTKGYHPPVYTWYKYQCENCESPILTGQPFCSGCGRKVKWE